MSGTSDKSDMWQWFGKEAVRYGCYPTNESDFCIRCGADFAVGIPLYTAKEKKQIRADLWNGWRLAAIGGTK